MEVRISRVVSEHYDYTRKEAEEYIRQGRVTRNGEVITIGDKASANDEIELDGVRIPLKGIFKKLEREAAGKESGNKFKNQRDDEYRDPFLNPKSRELRKGRKNEFSPKKKGKNSMY
ncbi:MAG: S4 domain-containing protein [Porphyromonas sp.]|nr:S4 domain-containing protein [Porphyromonas sp.]